MYTDMKKDIVLDPKDIPIRLVHRTIGPDTKHEELLHWHDEIELICIRKGKIHCHVNDSDFLLKKNELCCINLNHMHRVYNSEDSLCEMDVLIIRTEMLAGSAEIFDRYIRPVIDDRNFSHIRMDGRKSLARFISNTFDLIYELLEDKPEGYQLDVIGYIHMIFRRLYLAHAANTEITLYDSDAEIQRRMTSYIYEHYQDRISLDDIALSGGVSKSKCASLFQKYTQKTPFAYLNSYRLETASNLLETTDMPIADIAMRCGFSDQSYFTKQFRKEFGMTPISYRKAQ